ncbi:Piwi domain-containing protein [Gloeopeniophorella convolvens]|nr:Piwi domain-containing protein [Gloeopeniophorella convolvens]
MQAPQQSAVARREYGTSGRPVSVFANVFAIKALPSKPVYHYDVITPVEERPGRDVPMNMRRGHEIIHRLQNITEPSVFNPRAFFDGKKNLFSVGPLRMNGNTKTFTVNMSDSPQAAGSNRGQFRVVLTKVNDIRVNQLVNEIIAGGEIGQIALTFLQIVVRHAPMLKTDTFNTRSVFTPENRKSLGGGFNIWNGFFQSVRPTMDRLVINVDVSHAIVYDEMPVLDWACQFLSKFTLGRPRRYQVQDLARLSDEDFKLLKSVLKGVRVALSVPSGRRPTRPIKDLVKNVGGISFTKDGMETTIQQYYRERYNYTLRNPNLLGLCVNVRDQIIFPAEICTIVGGQMYKKVLMPGLASEVLNHVTTRPDKRLEAIKAGVASNFLDYRNSPSFSQIGMEVELEPTITPGRLLTPPDIQYHEGQARLSEDAHRGSHGTWNLVRRRFFKPAERSVWAVVSFAPSNFPMQEVVQRTDRLMQCCDLLDSEFAGATAASPSGGVERALDEGLAILNGKLSELRERYQLKEKPPCLILVVLPDSAAAQRKSVKAWGDVTRGVPTQCVLGGINSHPTSDIFRGLDSIPTMIVGADVTHPGPGVGDRPSIASLVSSYDRTFSHYAAFTRVQGPRTEVIEELEDMFLTSLRYFFHVTKKPPGRIIFYRDGVSEGEFQAVEDYEIKALSNAWNTFAGTEPPRPIPLAFIVVGKRHHVRFFSGARENIQDRTGNIFGGLVVDRHVVNPLKSDFYLQSHPGLKGTSRPSHYVILHNQLRMSPDILQQITYFLCHAYARCTRAVSIPAPIVCSRANFYLDENLGFSDFGSTSGSAFNLHDWQQGFKAPGPQKMYFV